ncbi:MAG: DUF6576 domain-containing protein, partial [Verrucomicrobiota bacterium]
GLLFLFEWFRAPESKRVDIGHLAHLGGALVGWSYAHAIGRAGVPFSVQSLRREREEMDSEKSVWKERTAKKEKEDPSVDAILDKISEKGIDSLSEKERKLLEQASEES